MQRSNNMSKVFQWVLKAIQKSCLSKLSIVIGYALREFTLNKP